MSHTNSLQTSTRSNITFCIIWLKDKQIVMVTMATLVFLKASHLNEDIYEHRFVRRTFHFSQVLFLHFPLFHLGLRYKLCAVQTS